MNSRLLTWAHSPSHGAAEATGRKAPGLASSSLSRTCGHTDPAGLASLLSGESCPCGRPGSGKSVKSEASPHSASCRPEREGGQQPEDMERESHFPKPCRLLGRSLWV